MSDNEFEDFDDTNGPKALRDALKETKKMNKQLQDRLNALEASDRTNSIDSSLRLRGVDPRVAKFYPGDRATTAESVEEWVEENKEFFGVSDTSSSPLASSLTPVEIEGYEIVRKIQAAEAATEMDFKSRLAAAETQEDVLHVMKEFGAQHTF